MKLSTPVTLTSYPFHLSYSDQILAVGSCFAEHIGSKLQALQFPTTLNPFGILYNPASIGQALRVLASDQIYRVEDLVQQGEFWHSWDHHGHYSGIDSNQVLTHINHTLSQTRPVLPQTRFLLITLGTAYVFRQAQTDKIVANCHKFSGDHFTRTRLSVEECVSTLLEGIQALKSLATKCEVILTVSPVRHLRDGLIENQRSKAILHLAVETLSQLDGIHYFPAYELLMDELRDYRFYAKDMAHPSDQAVEYIWECFTKQCMNSETTSLMKKVEDINRAKAHRPLFPDSEAHQKFKANLKMKQEKLRSSFPHLNFD